MIDTLKPEKRENKPVEATFRYGYENQYNPQISIHRYRDLWDYGALPEISGKKHSKSESSWNGNSMNPVGKNMISKLQHIEEEISHSEYLKTLEYDWDLQGSDPVDVEIYDTAVTFLRKYAEYLLTQRSITIGAPEINLCRDGSIDLSWRTKRARMLINIRRVENEMTAYFYGDLKYDKEPVKGHVPARKFANHLATWMENLEI